MAENESLHQAKTAKKDEFYTQMSDITAELSHYREHFRGKTVYCNCDDPYESNFFKYFALNFNYLGLKRLIATSYADSIIAGTQLSLFANENGENITHKTPYKAIISGVADLNNDQAENYMDIEIIMKYVPNTVEKLQGNGDFRSPECIELLKQADIVVTNPPFSLFREYVAQLIEYDKKFLIIGNKGAFAYKEIFPLIKENKIWTGVRNFSGGMWFYAQYEGKTEKIDEEGIKTLNVPACWFTNLEHSKRHEPIFLYRDYKPEYYPKYDNYDAINVDKAEYIPQDYYGIMGVPVTFMDKYCPEQFELIGLGTGDSAKALGVKKNYRGRTDLFYYDKDGKPQCPYQRLLIRRKQ